MNPPSREACVCPWASSRLRSSLLSHKALPAGRAVPAACEGGCSTGQRGRLEGGQPLVSTRARIPRPAQAGHCLEFDLQRGAAHQAQPPGAARPCPPQGAPHLGEDPGPNRGRPRPRRPPTTLHASRGPS